jgi:hypothetical protein
MYGNSTALGSSDHGSVASESEEWTHEDMVSRLCWLNFFTIDRDNPGWHIGIHRHI